jgi:hypothetical protein
MVYTSSNCIPGRSSVYIAEKRLEKSPSVPQNLEFITILLWNKWQLDKLRYWAEIEIASIYKF